MKKTVIKTLLVVSAILLASGGYAYYQNRTSTNSNEPAVMGETYESEQIDATPTPKEPSEKALKIAAFAMARVSVIKKAELKKRYGFENLDDTQFIREWALIMDNDPALLAKNEALMEKTIAQENKPVYYYEQTSTNPVINSNNNGLDNINSELRDQQNEIDAINREQQNREFWEGVCARRGEQYNSLVGAGCR